MNKRTHSKNWLRPGVACLAIMAVLLIAGGCRREIIHRNNDNDLPGFNQTVLVANSSVYSPGLVDTNLHNAWGLAWAPSGIAWVNSMAGHVSDLFTGDGAIVRAGINIPSPKDTIGGLPTGIVFAGGAGFTLSNKAAPNFLFAGVDGVISGWNGAAGNNAIRIANNSSTSSYTGLALTTWQGSHLLYAANFGAGRIDVWDTLFHKVNINFHDALIPPGFSPFNIQAIGSWLFVTYAKVGPDGRDQAGAGLGFVDIFQPNGVLVTRFAARGTLNAPWGLVEAPANFLRDNDMTTVTDNGRGGSNGNDGKGSPGGPGNGDNRGNGNGGNGDNSGPGNNNGNNNNNNDNDRNDDNGPFILVGNFGDGHINVFSLDGSFRGQLQSHHRTLVINGLWALSFAPSTSTIDQNRLYFTAGPNKEADGVFGYLLKQ